MNNCQCYHTTMYNRWPENSTWPLKQVSPEDNESFELTTKFFFKNFINGSEKIIMYRSTELYDKS